MGGVSADLSLAVNDRTLFHADNCYFYPRPQQSGKNSPFQTSGVIKAAHIERKIAGAFSETGCSVHISGRRITENFGEYRRPLYLFGAGHIGRELAWLLARMPFSVTWVDMRSGIFPQESRANITKLHTPSSIDCLNDAPQDAFILIITHSHDLDFALVNKVLAMADLISSALSAQKPKSAVLSDVLNKTVCRQGK